MSKPTNKSAPKKAQVFKFEGANGIKVEIPITASPAQIEMILKSMRPKKKAQPPAEPKPAKAEVPPQPVVPAAAAPIVPATEPKPEPTKSDAPAPAPIKPTPAALPPMIEPPKVTPPPPPIKREAPKPACKNPSCKSGLMPEQKSDGSYHAQCRICYEEWCVKSNVPIIPRTSNGEKVICGNNRCNKPFIPNAPHHRECSTRCHREKHYEAIRHPAPAKAPAPKQLAAPVINVANLEKLLKKAYLNGELGKLFPEAKASPVENSSFYVRIEHPSLKNGWCQLFEKAKAQAADAEAKRNKHHKPEADTKSQNGKGTAHLSN